MTRMVRMRRNFSTEHSNPIRTTSGWQHVFIIRDIREIRGLNIGSRVRKLFLLPALIGVLNLIPAGRVAAQTFTTLHTFTPLMIHDNGNFTFSFSNGDGATPYGGLITDSSGTTLYGTASSGGSSNYGTVFAVKTDGTGFTNLHSFTGGSGGASPHAGLIRTNNTLYGTAAGGSAGTVFAVNADGGGFTNLHSFAGGSDGVYPTANLILSANTLYGTASGGGSSGGGTVFAVNTDGTGFTNLHTFPTTQSDGTTGYTNSDGANPSAGLILAGNTLYGTAPRGGAGTDGTVFAVNTDGTGFINLHSFTPTAATGTGYTNSDGAGPVGGLILLGNTLYGTTSGGGTGGAGAVFAIHTDGTGFTNLHSFAAGVSINFGASFTNSEGAHPQARLILSGDTLYGTASEGGSSGAGTVFAVNTNGTTFTNLYTFTASNGANQHGSNTNSDGASPQAGLILSGNTLYGTASAGGSGGNGTVFGLSFRPQLTITPSGTNVILSWAVSYAGFSFGGYYLQETSNPLSPNGWATADPFPPIFVNGQYKVTRPMLGPQISYRLSRQ